jgi:single-stranded-DNA-specific exonuclease
MSAPAAFAAAIGGHPLVADVLWARGHRDPQAARAFLDPKLYTPAPPLALPGMAEAVARLRAAILGSERIRVWGDFDVDGQTSTSTLVLGLRALGAQVDYTIPNRVTHSHGLNRDGIARAREDGIVLLVTCDCGVTDFADIAYAGELGLDLIVTDHHDLALDADGLLRLPPEALAVVNPKRLPAEHPLANLPGVGVAYKVIEALTAAVNPMIWPDPLLDLVALGIVADVAHQAADTRYLLQLGLRRIHDNPRPGLRALLQMSGLDPAQVTADDIGFQIGPRLNAAGRLDTAELAVALLTAATDAEARPIAEKIEALNLDRRKLQRSVEESSERLLAQHPEWLERAALIMASPDWHPSVLGVVASGYAERLHRPAMLIAGDENGPPAVVRGSARGVHGLDVNAAILAQGHMLLASGGHPLAAGFAIPTDRIAEFREGIDAWLRAHARADAVDAEAIGESFSIAITDAAETLCAEIERLAPFGPGNERPILRAAPVRVTRTEPLGRDGRHQRVLLRDEGGAMREMVWWRSAGQSAIEGPCAVYFTLRRHVYRGQERAQMQLERLVAAPALDPSPAAQPMPAQAVVQPPVSLPEPAPAPARALAPAITARFYAIDLRLAMDRQIALDTALAEYGPGDCFIQGSLPGRERGSLDPGPHAVLIMLDAPPGLTEWERLVDAVKPQRVVLLTAPTDAQADALETLVRQAQGFLKTARLRGDDIDDPVLLARMAKRINQRVDTVKAAIDVALDRDPAARGRIAYLLAETVGFRRLFQTAPAAEL